MNRSLVAALLLATLALRTDRAAARVVTLEPAAPAPAADAPADILRSAFYLRGTHRDVARPPATAGERQLRIQRHFDLVLHTLAMNFDRGLVIALARLERARGADWTTADRNGWRAILAHRRLVNMHRLRLYQQRGLFPQNEHVADRAVPVFVDNDGTACAVGHLMRESGSSAAVAAISAANNLVFVTDVHDGPLVDWVLTSGLTQEEAALIQPSYYPPMFDARFDALTQGESLTRNGLHFDNFHWIAGELTEPLSFPEVPPSANQVDLAGYGAAVRQGAFGGMFGSQPIDPAYEDWLFTGAVSESYSIFPNEKPWGLLFSYEVAPVDSDERLVATSLESFTANYNFHLDGVLAIESHVYAGGSADAPLLAALELFDASAGAFFEGVDSASFAPQKSLKVVTAVQL
jgi:hypothetical protein